MRWAPLAVAEVRELFTDFPAPWWIAGGWAVDHAVGRQTREHDDIDVVVLHQDAAALQHLLDHWDLWVADPPGTLRPWGPEQLEPEVRDVWCRRGCEEPWCLQVMLDLADGDEWIWRRDPSVRRPLSSLGEDHVLAPDVQLLWKSFETRPKDDEDFRVLLDLLTDEQADWLLHVLPPDHAWRAEL